MSFTTFATAEVVNVHCSAELIKVRDGEIIVMREKLAKKVKMSSPFLANKTTKVLKLNETINFGHEYSLRITLKERFEDLAGKVKSIIKATLYRHRVGNGKIVLGETTRTIEASELGSIPMELLSLEVRNDLEYRNLSKEVYRVDKGVVKKAFLECSTL